MPSPPDAHVSPNGDPTPVVTLMHSTTWMKLKTLNLKQARHNSHLQFIKKSLRNNVIPRGLTIKTSLQAEDADQPLHRKWNNIIHGTQIKDDLEVRGIEKIRDHGSTQWRKHRESYWIFQLRTLAPNGINLDEWVTTVPWRCQACLQQRTSYDTLD